MSVHTAIVGLLWRVLETYDIDPSSVIPSAMYRPGRYIAERSYVSSVEYSSVVGAALRLIDDEKAGIRAAGLVHPSHLGIFGHAWLASPTLLASLRMLERYARVFNADLSVRIEEDRDEVRAIYESNGASPFNDIDADAQVGGLIHFCRLQYGSNFMPEAVALVREAPEDRRAWDEHFGVKVRFGESRNCASISATVAHELLTSAHAALFEDHQERLAQNLAELSTSDIVGRVRVAIQQLLPAAEVTEEKVADIVATNVRTLHRRLSEHGLSFRALLKETRMKLARRYIADDGYSITDVAFMLGYSDVSAFSRAFRSWFDMTPSQFRASES